MSRVKQSHIVPEFYLQYFTNTYGKIYVFDKPNFKDFESKPNKVAKQGGFYDLDGIIDINLKQIIEARLESIETKTAPIYKQLIDRIESGKFNGILEEERFILSEFIITQMFRTSGSRNMITQAEIELNNQLKDKVSDEDYTLFCQEMGSLDSKLMQLSMLASTQEEQLLEIGNRIWLIYENNTTYKFHTSDHPVCTHNHGDIFNTKHEIFFPLTPKLMLSLLQRQQFLEFAPLDNKILPLNEIESSKWYNCAIIFIAERQIFSNESHFIFAKKVLTENPEYKILGQQRINGPDYKKQ